MSRSIAACFSVSTLLSVFFSQPAVILAQSGPLSGQVYESYHHRGNIRPRSR